MTNKFLKLTDALTNKSILINRDLILTIEEDENNNMRVITFVESNCKQYVLEKMNFLHEQLIKD